MADYTTISVKKETKKRLEDKGKKGQTFDELINELIDKIEKQR